MGGARGPRAEEETGRPEMGEVEQSLSRRRVSNCNDSRVLTLCGALCSLLSTCSQPVLLQPLELVPGFLFYKGGNNKAPQLSNLLKVTQ